MEECLTREQFIEYITVHATDVTASPSAPSPVVVRASDVVPEDTQWLWKYRFPLGALSMLVGPGGQGKTMMMMDLIARITSGRDAPDGSPLKHGWVLIISAEDSISNTLISRLKAAGADLTRVVFLTGIKVKGRVGWLDLQRHLTAIEQAIRDMGDCVLVLFDPITAYMGKIDGNSNTDVRGVLGPLSELAARRGVAIIGISHLTKASTESVVNRVLGSVGFTATARSVYAVGKDRNDPTLRLFLPAKANLAPPDVHGLGFRIVGGSDGQQPTVDWSPVPVATSCDEAFAPPENRRGPDAEELNRAMDFLKTELASGPRPSSEILETAREAESISKPTLDRAKKQLGVVSYKEGSAWFMRMPEPAPEALSTKA